MTPNQQMQRFLGGIEQGYKAINHATGAYTIKIYDALIYVDTSTGTISNLTLPSTVPVGTIREHTVIDKGGQANTNPITVLAPGGGTINGAASLVIDEPFGGVTFTTDDGVNYTAATAAAGVVGPSNAVYVDPAGDNNTGTRGNAAFPFLTIEAALAITQNGDELLIAPGTFSPTVALTPPVGVQNLIVRGSGNGESGAGGGTIIDNTNIGGANIWDFINLMNNLQMENLTIDGANLSINLDGSTSGGNFGLGGVRIRNVTAGGGLAALDVNFLSWTGGELAGSCVITTCSHVVFSGLDSSSVGAVITWDAADANAPVTVRDAVYYSATQIGGVSIAKQGAVEVGKGSSCLNLQGNGLTVGGGLAPIVRCYGIVRDIIDFDTAGKQLPDSATACTMNFDGALIQGATIKFSVAGAPPTHRQTVTMRNATIPSAAITSGSAIDIVGEDMAFGTAVTTTNSGAPVGTILQENARATSATPSQLTSADEHLDVDTSAGNRTVRVPLTMMKGWTCRVQKTTTDTNTITFARNGFTGNIQNAAADYTPAISAAIDFPWFDVYFDGTNVWIQ